jgi:hypothetical protein
MRSAHHPAVAGVGAAPVAMRESRRTDLLLLVTLFVASFERVQWQFGFSVTIADVLTLAYLASFTTDRVRFRDFRLPRTALVTLTFSAAFLICDLAGFFNIDTTQGLAQFSKGMAKLLVHLVFLTVAIVHLSRRSQRFYWNALALFFAGLTANAAYALVQRLALQAGTNIDTFFLNPITNKAATSLAVFGVAAGQNVYRPNGLTGDPNHLAVMLIVPLLIVFPIYLRLERGHRLRWPLAGLLCFLLVGEIATFSRSGGLGLGVGFLVLLVPYWRRLVSARFLVPFTSVSLFLAAVFLARQSFFTTLIRSRLQANGRSAAIHFDVYSFIPQVLRSHPLLGFGLNNFSVYYQFVTGKSNWGPHSYFVSVLVEGGIVGATLFALFVWYLFRRLGALRALGRSLDRRGNPLAARVRPLAWGMTAALVGTLASNIFYLTIQFYYFYAFAVFALAAPLVFSRREVPKPARAPELDGA